MKQTSSQGKLNPDTLLSSLGHGGHIDRTEKRDPNKAEQAMIKLQEEADKLLAKSNNCKLQVF